MNSEYIVVHFLGNGKVGADENLIYEIELIDIKDGTPQGPVESFNQIDQDHDGYLTMEEVCQLFIFKFWDLLSAICWYMVCGEIVYNLKYYLQ